MTSSKWYVVHKIDTSGFMYADLHTKSTQKHCVLRDSWGNKLTVVRVETFLIKNEASAAMKLARDIHLQSNLALSSDFQSRGERTTAIRFRNGNWKKQ